MARFINLKHIRNEGEYRRLARDIKIRAPIYRMDKGRGYLREGIGGTWDAVYETSLDFLDEEVHPSIFLDPTNSESVEPEGKALILETMLREALKEVRNGTITTFTELRTWLWEEDDL